MNKEVMKERFPASALAYFYAVENGAKQFVGIFDSKEAAKSIAKEENGKSVAVLLPKNQEQFFVMDKSMFRSFKPTRQWEVFYKYRETCSCFAALARAEHKRIAAKKAVIPVQLNKRYGTPLFVY